MPCRHQIRVHALEIGHPIVGDYTYGGDERSSRMYLHSYRLVIPKEEEVGKIIFETETFSSLAWRKCKHFFTNITLEPVMLFYGIVGWVGFQ